MGMIKIFLHLGAVFIISSIIFLNNFNKGEFWMPDESRHAMDGVFILDIVKDISNHKVKGLREYAEKYFWKYPALGINRYPPVFSSVEAVFFAVMEVSVSMNLAEDRVAAVAPR